jgi:hypothetical protein
MIGGYHSKGDRRPAAECLREQVEHVPDLGLGELAALDDAELDSGVCGDERSFWRR